MVRRTEYQKYRDGEWRLLACPEMWSVGLWSEVQRQVEAASHRAHPQTHRFRYPPGQGAEFHLKIYHPSDFSGAFKDLCRDSKAFRALKQGRELSRAGFHTPVPVAAGERRRWRFLHQAFLLTRTVEGTLLPYFVSDHYADTRAMVSSMAKRRGVRQLAEEIGRLHRCGFVHGDLIPYNIVIQKNRNETRYFFIDNDRTRRYRWWFPHRLWKRNLVQLNRFSLPGISRMDRLRFFYFYMGGRSWGGKERQLIRWVDEKTRERQKKENR